MMIGKVTNSNYALLILPGLIFLSLYLTLGYDGFYGQDAYAYLSFSDTINEKGISAIWQESFFWPKLYSSLGGILSFLGIPTMFALCFISAISLGLAAVFIKKILLKHKIPQQEAALIAMIGVVLAPYLLRSGLSAMTDSLFLCLITLFCFMDTRFRNSNGPLALITLSFLAVLIFNTRYVGILICLPIVFLYLYKSIMNRHYTHLLFGCLILTIPILQYFQSPSSGLSSHHFLDNWSINNWFLSSFEGGERPFKFALINILHSLRSVIHPGYSFLVLPLIFVAIRKRLKPDVTIIASVVIYILFIAGIPFQNDRFLIVVPVLLIIAFRDAIPAGLAMLSNIKFKRAALVITVISGAGLSLFAMKTPITTNHNERMLTMHINEMNYSSVISFEVDVALDSRLSDVTIHSLWDLDTLKTFHGSHLILNNLSIQESWQGTRVDQNLSHLKRNYQWHLSKELDGYKDYRLE